MRVLALSDQRSGAPEAATLYEESAESIARREPNAARKAAGGMLHRPERRPSKKHRRQIHRFKQDTGLE